MKEVESENWGIVQTLRAHFNNGDEIEFNFTTSDWARVDLIDEGTKRTVSDGMKIIHDPNGILQKLLQALNSIKG